LQVEVSVQDFFYGSSQSELSIELSKSEANAPIAAETWETWLSCWLETLQDSILSAPIYELSLRLTDNAEIQSLNAQYRHQDEPTDVLAFASLEVDFPQPPQLEELLPLYLGDIVISVETAQRQALQQGHSLQTELAWLAAHGLLHLLGWDHPDEESLTRMLNQQVKLLDKIGLAINTA
jgi:probable rRNA maturation factor